MADGTELDFTSDPSGYALLRDSVIVRTTNDGAVVAIPIDSVQLSASTRYPTPGEKAFQNLLIISAVITALVWLITHPISFRT